MSEIRMLGAQFKTDEEGSRRPAYSAGKERPARLCSNPKKSFSLLSIAAAQGSEQANEPKVCDNRTKELKKVDF
jgi:hypothetical protein